MPLTYFYAQLFGLVCLLFGLAMVANRRAMLEVIREFMEHRASLFVIAFISLFVGLVVVLTHNIWSGSALDIVVTLVGWLLILRAVFFLFLPHGTLRKLFAAARLEQTYYIIAAVVLIVGVYLTYAGFWG